MVIWQKQLESRDESILAGEGYSTPEKPSMPKLGRSGASEPLNGEDLDLGPLGNFLLAR